MGGRRSALVTREPIWVVFGVGASQVSGIRNAITELPSNYNPSPNPKALMWDRYVTNSLVQLIPGVVESQPLGPDVASGFSNTVGPCGAFMRHWGAFRPSEDVAFFFHQEGGGRFSDAASLGRQVNYLQGLPDGACASLIASWLAFCSALAARGRTPRLLIGFDDGIGNGFASNNAAEMASWGSDMQAFKDWCRANIVGNVKWGHSRLSLTMTAISTANLNTQRAAAVTLVQNDPNSYLINCDGLPTTTFDNLHGTAGWHDAFGEMLAYSAMGFWYPESEIEALGGNPMTWGIEPGSVRNTPGTAVASTAMQDHYDIGGSAVKVSQGTVAKQALLTTTTLANGYPARSVTADGAATNGDIMTAGSTGDVFGTSYGFACIFSAPATATKCAVAAGGATINPAIAYMLSKSDGLGGLQQFIRRDDGTSVTLDLLSSGVFDNSLHTLAINDSGGSVTATLDGVDGSAQTYTRGTISLTSLSVYGASTNNRTSETWQQNINLRKMWRTKFAMDATYKSNLRTYGQRRFAAP